MTTKKKRTARPPEVPQVRVWLLERLERGEWEPFMGMGGGTLADARHEMRLWQLQLPLERFRLIQYQRVLGGRTVLFRDDGDMTDGHD